MREKLSIKDFPSYKDNPTPITGIVRKEYKLKAEEFETVNPSTGECFITRPSDKKIISFDDKRTYVKLYKESLLLIGNLSVVALKLFTYISYNLKQDKDIVSIDIMEFLTLFEYSAKEKDKTNKTHYYKAIVELLEKKIVYKKAGEDHSFYINIDVFFNGKREGFYNDKQNL